MNIKQSEEFFTLLRFFLNCNTDKSLENLISISFPNLNLKDIKNIFSII